MTMLLAVGLDGVDAGDQHFALSGVMAFSPETSVLVRCVPASCVHRPIRAPRSPCAVPGLGLVGGVPGGDQADEQTQGSIHAAPRVGHAQSIRRAVPSGIVRMFSRVVREGSTILLDVAST